LKEEIKKLKPYYAGGFGQKKPNASQTRIPPSSSADRPPFNPDTDLDDKERQEFSRKLVLPPLNKLKNMIDQLYVKEKKYVRQYYREDFIEQNNFIFNIGRAHTLGTNKQMKESHSAERAPVADISIGKQ